MRRGIPLGDGVVPAAFPRVVRFPRQLQRAALRSQGAFGSEPVARRRAGRGSGAEASAMDRRPQSFLQQHHVRRGLRLDTLCTVSVQGRWSGRFRWALKPGVSADAPYWPAQICWTYKEVWTQPVGEWIWLMHDLSGPAVVEGVADSANRSPVQLVDEKTGQVLDRRMGKEPRGIFVPWFRRAATRSGKARSILRCSLLSAGSYRVDLRKGKAVDLTARVQNRGSRRMSTVQLEAEGTGPHRFTLRADNLDLREPAEQEVRLEQGRKAAVTWHARIADVRTPWVGVLVQDGDVEKRTRADRSGARTLMQWGSSRLFPLRRYARIQCVRTDSIEPGLAFILQQRWWLAIRRYRAPFVVLQRAAHPGLISCA